MSWSKKTREPEENATLGPAVREGEFVPSEWSTSPPLLRTPSSMSNSNPAATGSPQAANSSPNSVQDQETEVYVDSQSQGTFIQPDNKRLKSVVKCRQARKGLKRSTSRMEKDSKGTVTLGNYGFDEEVVRKELALMICLHEYPLSIVDHIGFRKFCAVLQPLFNMVSRNTAPMTT